MRATRKWSVGLGLAGIFWLFATAAPALILVNTGDKPVQNMGWPGGSENVANSPGRIRYMEGPPFGGGEYSFEFHFQGTEQFAAALQKFAAIRVPRIGREAFVSMSGGSVRLTEPKALLLVVHDGPRPDPAAKKEAAAGGEEARVDWTFTVWSPRSYYHLFSGSQSAFDSDHPNYRQPVPPPRIDVYVAAGGPIDWAKVKLPDGVRVADLRAEAAPTIAKAGGVVRGGIFDMATHQGIAGAEVVLVPQAQGAATGDPFSAQTDAAGSYEVTGVRSGNYEIVVSADGFASRRVGNFDNAAGHAVLDFDLLLARKAPLRGTVVDDKGGPLAGVRVTARNVLAMDGLGYVCQEGTTAATDDQGGFEFTSLPEGYTGLDCSSPPLHQQSSILERYQVTAMVPPSGKKPEVKIVMTGTGTVRGKVTDRDGKAPSVQMMAEIEPKGGSKVGSWGGSMQCKEGGAFEFSGVPPGDYVVTVRPNPGRETDVTEPKPVTVTTGGTQDLEIVSDHAHAAGPTASPSRKQGGAG